MSDPINTIAPPVMMEVTLDLTHPMFRKPSGIPDARKIGRTLRELGARFKEGGEKELGKLAGTLMGPAEGGYTKAGQWVIHTNDGPEESK